MFHFKLRKELFKRDLERNGKSKNILEIDVEKDDGIIFWKKYKLDKDNPFNIKVTYFTFMLLRSFVIVLLEDLLTLLQP